MTNLLSPLLGGLRTTFVGGTRLFVLAPVIPLLAIVPEFAQHVAEIRLGMFESRSAFVALAMDPTRWAFGYAKVAGLVLAILAATRYWGGARERWWDLRSVAWRPFLIALAINLVAGVALMAVQSQLAGAAGDAFYVAGSIVTLPLLLMLVGPLLGDRTMTLRRAYTGGWVRLALTAILAVLAFAPLQMLHGLNHQWAFGARDVAVWGLMAWDALIVGLLACWTGSALAAGYRGGDADAADGEPFSIR